MSENSPVETEGRPKAYPYLAAPLIMVGFVVNFALLWKFGGKPDDINVPREQLFYSWLGIAAFAYGLKRLFKLVYQKLIPPPDKACETRAWPYLVETAFDSLFWCAVFYRGVGGPLYLFAFSLALLKYRAKTAPCSTLHWVLAFILTVILLIVTAIILIAVFLPYMLPPIPLGLS